MTDKYTIIERKTITIVECKHKRSILDEEWLSGRLPYEYPSGQEVTIETTFEVIIAKSIDWLVFDHTVWQFKLILEEDVYKKIFYKEREAQELLNILNATVKSLEDLLLFIEIGDLKCDI